jgi:hypothetical protein
MASKKKSRYYPVQSRISLSAGGIVIAPNALSMINRRHYPAAGVYECNITMNPTITGQVVVYALKDNWDTIGAIRLAYKAYLEATKDERSVMSKKQVARWEDFRIAHDTGLTEMVPMVHDVGVGSTVLAVGEFENSTIVDKDGNNRYFSIENPTSTTRFNILSQWSAAGNVDTDPVTSTSSAPYADLNPLVNAQQGAEMQTDGNNPPYDANGNDGLTSAWVKVATLTNGGAASGRLSTGYFRAPLGMILVTGVTGNAWGELQVREGNTKGIKVHNLLG